MEQPRYAVFDVEIARIASALTYGEFGALIDALLEYAKDGTLRDDLPENVDALFFSLHEGSRLFTVLTGES